MAADARRQCFDKVAVGRRDGLDIKPDWMAGLFVNVERLFADRWNELYHRP
jgi:hypothetical protein